MAVTHRILSSVLFLSLHNLAYAAQQNNAASWPNRAGCSSRDKAIGVKQMIFNIYGSYYDIYTLIGGILFISGFLFVVFSLFKLKQHRDNPAQVPIGMAITYSLVGIGLIFLPNLIFDVRATIFGTESSNNYGISKSLTESMKQNPGFAPSTDQCDI